MALNKKMMAIILIMAIFCIMLYGFFLTGKLDMKILVARQAISKLNMTEMEMSQTHSQDLNVTKIDQGGILFNVTLSNVRKRNDEELQREVLLNETEREVLLTNTTVISKVVTDSPSCKPSTQIVFIKTHKTASTTTNTIIQAYGLRHQLTFAMPIRHRKFRDVKYFSRDMLFQKTPSKNGSVFNILAMHFVYNRAELERVVPDAKYITIIREPVSKFESTFGYYDVPGSLNLARTRNQNQNPLELFMTNPDSYLRRLDRDTMIRNQLRNGMMFTLGFNHKYDNSTRMIDRTIQKLDDELNLVLLTEYYEESLLLMKKMLCWDFEDILYIPKGFRNSTRRYNVSKTLAERISKWNNADVQLYKHFNKTFWQRVKEYGPDLDKDLKKFRELQNKFYNECVDSTKTELRKDREDALVMRKNAPVQCELAFLRVYNFENMLQKVYTGRKRYPTKFLVGPSTNTDVQ
ncbi:galactosylceramide sulfotransferase-like [Glandiceps talaboti]